MIREPFIVAIWLCIFVAGVFSCYPQYQEGLTNFLTEKLRDYPAYLKEHNADPTPQVIDGWVELHSPDNDRLVVVSLILSKVIMSNVSETRGSACGYGIPDRPDVRIHRNMSFAYEGEYALSGIITETSGNTIPFSGNGRFKIPQLSHTDWSYKRNIEEYEAQQFQEIDGHWNISTPGTYQYYNLRSVSDMERMDFEGLLENNEKISIYEDAVKTEIVGIVDKYLDDNDYHRDHFMKQHMTDFLQNLFLETSVEEIVQWPKSGEADV